MSTSTSKTKRSSRPADETPHPPPLPEVLPTPARFQGELALRILQSLHVLQYDLSQIDSTKLTQAPEFWEAVRNKLAACYSLATGNRGENAAPEV
jgi:hypothetical protein